MDIRRIIALFVLTLCLVLFGVLLGRGHTLYIAGGTNSMYPAFKGFDLLVHEHPDLSEVEVGDIVGFHDSSLDRNVAHRVIVVRLNGTIYTKGDNNLDRDFVVTTEENFLGRIKYVVPSHFLVLYFVIIAACMAALVPRRFAWPLIVCSFLVLGSFLLQIYLDGFQTKLLLMSLMCYFSVVYYVYRAYKNERGNLIWKNF